MRIDHVGIAGRSLDAALRTWASQAGIEPPTPEEIASQQVRVAFVPFGDSDVELLEPTASDSPVGRFLAARGEGMHHVALQVPSVDEALQRLESRGVRVVDRKSRPGARGHRVGFAHPSAFGGVLVEFVEHRP